MKLIVGLGNPGRKYLATRHNIGFEAVHELAKRYLAGPPKKKFRAHVSDVRIHDELALLLWPQTYMNLSGQSVSEAVGFYKLQLEDLLVVCDDFHLPLGRLRVRPRGSAGGQKGLDDILRCLADRSVARLRIGVGPLPAGWDAANFVLSRFSEEQKQEVWPVITRAADAAARWVEAGTDVCMNEFNPSPKQAPNQAPENGDP